MPSELMWEQGRPPHVYSETGRCYWLSLRPTWPSSSVTFIQPFASPEVDLEGMWLTTFRCLLLLKPPQLFFSLPFISSPVLLSCFLHGTSFSLRFVPPSLFLSLPVTQQRVASVNQVGPFSFAAPWLVLMMFPKRWRGQLRGHPSCSPLFTACRFMSPALFFSPFLPHSSSLSYHIFNIINIDRVLHLEPLLNNWLPRLMQALMVSAGG